MLTLSFVAAAFLKQFVQPSVFWAHLDIAGVAMTSEKRGWLPKGGTGYGVHLLVEMVRRLSEIGK